MASMYPTPSPPYTIKKHKHHHKEKSNKSKSKSFKFHHSHHHSNSHHGVKRTEGLSALDTPRALVGLQGGKGKGGGIGKIANGNGKSGKGKRERAFRCPNAGCTKTYLNPNGLKYHLEKGTCKIEGREDMEESGPGSPFPFPLPPPLVAGETSRHSVPCLSPSAAQAPAAEECSHVYSDSKFSCRRTRRLYK
ncbi:hypothetical protein BDQ17DRAFT_231850 [Cyathus striatus]|nr:hypothetical protein BDQ17DRAFT_231850 [Cyathus striatus]